MCRAGRGAFRTFLDRWPDLDRPAVVCGSGNNGGDGYVFAREALQAGLNPTVFAVSKSKTQDSLSACDSFLKAGGIVSEFDISALTANCDSIVDAVFGIGLSRNLNRQYQELITDLNSSGLPILALDIPSGLDADSGAVRGNAVRADATVTFIVRKIGLLTGRGRAYCGDTTLESLDIPVRVFDNLPSTARIVDAENLIGVIPRRMADAHKGAMGRVAIVGGDDSMEGAAQLAAQAAYRTGAGLVFATMNRDFGDQSYFVVAEYPEVRMIKFLTRKKLMSVLDRMDAIAVGPGLGQRVWGKYTWEEASTSSAHLVVDADALNLLAARPKVRKDWILTPHAGEAACLLGTTAKKIQSDRLGAATKIVERYGGVCVLKGSGTLIVSGEETWLCDRGNAGMATGGMGDILAGVIATLRAQGLSSIDAARAGVWIHAAAADDCAQTEGEIGMIATDLLPWIRKRINWLVNESGN